MTDQEKKAKAIQDRMAKAAGIWKTYLVHVNVRIYAVETYQVEALDAEDAKARYRRGESDYLEHVETDQEEEGIESIEEWT